MDDNSHSTEFLIDEDIQEIFYNMILETVMRADELHIAIDFDNPIFIKQIIKSILHNIVPNIYRIKSTSGILITSKNVSDEYKHMFKLIEDMHEQLISRSISGSTEQNKFYGKIIEEISKRDTFNPMIKKVKVFYDEMNKSQDVSIAITVDMIRDTFYNMMVENTILSGYFTKDDLISREPYIFIGLTAYTIFDLLMLSRDCAGIKLLNNLIVTDATCPIELKDLCGIILKLKAIIYTRSLSHEQIQYIKVKILQNADLPDYHDISAKQIDEIIDIIPIITDISIDISRNDHFKAIIDEVIKFCIEAM